MPALTVKGQVTIPKAVREHLGLAPGMQVAFVVQQDGSVRVQAAQARPQPILGAGASDARMRRAEQPG
jgi:antitoxin PrlF